MVKTLGADKPIWAWLLRHAGWQISRYKQKDNGMTARMKQEGCKDEEARERQRRWRPRCPVEADCLLSPFQRFHHRASLPCVSFPTSSRVVNSPSATLLVCSQTCLRNPVSIDAMPRALLPCQPMTKGLSVQISLRRLRANVLRSFELPAPWSYSRLGEQTVTHHPIDVPNRQLAPSLNLEGPLWGGKQVETAAGGNGHVPRLGIVGQHVVAGKAGQEKFQFCVGSTWLCNGKRWQGFAALFGKEQFARGSPCVAATDEDWMCGSWDNCRGRQHGSCGRSRGRAANRCLTVPMLKSWMNIKELHARLRELGALIYGSKDVLFLKAMYVSGNRRGLFGEQDENVGIGDRAGDAKDLLSSSSTI